jgi:broad specificity phosphatase PhoE
MASEVVLIRHGATEWSGNGRHTGCTDIPLTDEGRAAARALAPRVAQWDFSLVLVSPLQRARETCDLVGLGDGAVVDDDLHEWDYGDYEGVTTKEIRETVPGWTVFTGPVPNGETPDQVGARADRVIARADAADGTVALVAHGHILRVLGARWCSLPPTDGARLCLDTSTLCVLGYERETKCLRSWNCSLS